MIRVRNLFKSFGKNRVLVDLSIDVEEGETLVILGASGTGKSVLLKHIIGITKPDSGTVEVNGFCISDLTGPDLYAAIRRMGMLFQGAALFDSLTVEKNTSFYLDQHGDPDTGKRYTRAEIAKRVVDSLAMVDLAGTEKKMPSELSGGMRKRAGLARLIAYKPKIFLYDEPTTGLDPITAMHINELIIKTQREFKASSIVVTHDILSALMVADRIALMKDGKIVHSADPFDFLTYDDPWIAFLRKTVPHDPRKLREEFHG